AGMASYSVIRFFIEFVRAENPAVLAGLTMAQLIGILALAASIVAWKKISASKAMRVMPNLSAVEISPNHD
ncbi:MAG: hypothetical protein ACD_39C00141G0001, partial [uncultured bacterium]